MTKKPAPPTETLGPAKDANEPDPVALERAAKDAERHAQKSAAEKAGAKKEA